MSNDVPTEGDYACGIPTSSMAEREPGEIEGGTLAMRKRSQ
jgi:hypothetical protein